MPPVATVEWRFNLENVKKKLKKNLITQPAVPYEENRYRYQITEARQREV